MKTLIYPGTFDPITNGHLDLIERGSRLCERLIVAIAVSKSKQPVFDLEQRLDLCREVLQALPNVEVTSFSGLLIDFASEQQSCAVLRGLRSASDFEFELQLATMNRRMNSEVETLFMTPAEDCAAISSTLVREIAGMGGTVDSFVPELVARALRARFN